MPLLDQVGLSKGWLCPEGLGEEGLAGLELHRWMWEYCQLQIVLLIFFLEISIPAIFYREL